MEDAAAKLSLPLCATEYESPGSCSLKLREWSDCTTLICLPLLEMHGGLDSGIDPSHFVLIPDRMSWTVGGILIKIRPPLVLLCFWFDLTASSIHSLSSTFALLSHILFLIICVVC
jgi:hypothetical protein